MRDLPQATPEPERSEDDATAVSLWSYINILLRWRLLIVGLPLAFALATAAWILLRPREYEARASFVPQDPKGSESNFGQIASQLGLANRNSTTSSPEFYASLLQSREVMRKVLTTEYQVAGSPSFRGTLVEFFGLGGEDSTDAILRGMDRLAEAVDIGSNRNVGVVSLAVRTERPAFSIAVANRFLDLVNEYNLRRRQSQAREEREFVGQQLQEANGRLTQAEESLSGFLSRNRDYDNSPVLRAAFGRLEREIQLRQQLYLSLNENFQKARIEEVRNTPVITVIERPETLVEPIRRHLLRKTLLALLFGSVLAVGLAFFAEFVRNSARGDVPDYGKFVSLRRQAFGRLSRFSGGRRSA